MISTAKFAFAAVVTAFLSFALVLVSLHFEAKSLFIIGLFGCIGGVVLGLVSIILTIFLHEIAAAKLNIAYQFKVLARTWILNF